MAQFVYTMNRVGKVVPPKREILKDISLSFFPGAKIGVLGLNGSGKSTLLRIMAGIDTDHSRRGPPATRHPHRLPAAGAATRSQQGRARQYRRSRRADQGCPSGSTKSMPPTPIPTPISTNEPLEQANWNLICTPPTAITWIAPWMSPPTRCVCRPGMRM
jgi:energy-coupling factor transporter ATP-binding protein EcfA2